jgi:hypothetical protein
MLKPLAAQPNVKFPTNINRRGSSPLNPAITLVVIVFASNSRVN